MTVTLVDTNQLARVDVVGMNRCVTGATEDQVIHHLHAEYSFGVTLQGA